MNNVSLTFDRLVLGGGAISLSGRLVGALRSSCFVTVSRERFLLFCFSKPSPMILEDFSL